MIAGNWHDLSLNISSLLFQDLLLNEIYVSSINFETSAAKIFAIRIQVLADFRYEFEINKKIYTQILISIVYMQYSCLFFLYRYIIFIQRLFAHSRYIQSEINIIKYTPPILRLYANRH